MRNAIELLTTSWKTERLPIPQPMEAPFMRMIELPELEGLSTYASRIIFISCMQKYCTCSFLQYFANIRARLSSTSASHDLQTKIEYRSILKFQNDMILVRKLE